MKRTAVRKKDSQLVALWMPRQMEDSVSQAVIIEDTDRSKFIRRAVKEKLQRMGINVPAEITR